MWPLVVFQELPSAPHTQTWRGARRSTAAPASTLSLPQTSQPVALDVSRLRGQAAMAQARRREMAGELKMRNADLEERNDGLEKCLAALEQRLAFRSSSRVAQGTPAATTSAQLTHRFRRTPSALRVRSALRPKCTIPASSSGLRPTLKLGSQPILRPRRSEISTSRHWSPS